MPSYFLVSSPYKHNLTEELSKKRKGKFTDFEVLGELIKEINDAHPREKISILSTTKEGLNVISELSCEKDELLKNMFFL